MKKILLLIISLFPFLVMAKDYDIKDINLKFNVSDEWIAFTRDNLDNNKDLEDLGLTKDDLLPSYKLQGIYFDGIKDGIELLVMVPNIKLEVNNLSHYSENVVKETANELGKKLNTDKVGTYYAKHKFATVNYFDSKTQLYIVNYYTVVNAKGYNFQIQKSTEITDEDIKSLEKIIDTVEIETLPGYEKDETKEKSFSFKNILIDALIGAAVGGLGALVLKLTKKKSS